jgi:hypothetical protein
MAILPSGRGSPIEGGNGREEAVEIPPDPKLDPFRRLVPAESENATGLGLRDPSIGGSNRPMEGQRLPLQAIRRSAQPDARKAHLRGKIEKVGPDRSETAGRKTNELAHLLLPQTTTATLIGNGGIAEAVGDDDAPLLERRPDLSGHELSPRGKIEKEFGARGDAIGRRIEENSP